MPARRDERLAALLWVQRTGDHGPNLSGQIGIDCRLEFRIDQLSLESQAFKVADRFRICRDHRLAAHLSGESAVRIGGSFGRASRAVCAAQCRHAALRCGKCGRQRRIRRARRCGAGSAAFHEKVGFRSRFFELGSLALLRRCLGVLGTLACRFLERFCRFRDRHRRGARYANRHHRRPEVAHRGFVRLREAARFLFARALLLAAVREHEKHGDRRSKHECSFGEPLRLRHGLEPLAGELAAKAPGLIGLALQIFHGLLAAFGGVGRSGGGHDAAPCLMEVRGIPSPG